jgi:hypothetical protein
LENVNFNIEFLRIEHTERQCLIRESTSRVIIIIINLEKCVPLETMKSTEFNILIVSDIWYLYITTAGAKCCVAARTSLKCCYILLVLRDHWVEDYWELSTAPAGARGREEYCTFVQTQSTIDCKFHVILQFVMLLMDHLFLDSLMRHNIMCTISHTPAIAKTVINL